MRTVFFGTPELAVPCLEAVARHHEVCAVVCRPDRPKGRSGKPVPPPVKCCAERLGLPVHQPKKLNDGAFEAWLKERAPEVCAIVAYGRLLKQPILDVPPKGWLNVHPSLLPRHRGPSPIQTAILEGDAETGVSVMRVILEMDAGDVLLRESTAIDPDETSAELSDRLGKMGVELLVRGLALLESGEAEFTPQDTSAVTVTRLFEKEDGRIRWSEPAPKIHNLVRACVPWPVAHCLYKGDVCRIHRSAVVDAPTEAAPGTIVAVAKDHIRVATGSGLLDVLVFQAPGKRAIPVADFLRGHKMEPGERFEDIV